MSRNKNQQVSADATDLQIGDSPTTTAVNVQHIDPTLENTLKVLQTLPGYVSIGVSGSGGAAQVPAEIVNKFNFNDKGASEDQMDATFDFTTVTGQRRINWKSEQDGKEVEQHSYVLENCSVTAGGKTFLSSVPFGAYQEMVAAGNNTATFSLKKSSNKAGTRTYYSLRIINLKAA